MRRVLCLMFVVILSMALSACGAFSRSKAPSSKSAAGNGDGIYVASMAIADIQQMNYGMWAAVGFDINTFPVEVKQIGILNRWNGAPGKHQDETRLLNRNREVVAKDGSELSGESPSSLHDQELSQMAMDVLNVANLLPGTYDVVVLLDGREYARYMIRLTATATGGNRPPTPR